MTPAPARFDRASARGWIVGRDEMAGLDPSTLVIDARAAERYRGETEPIDPRAGHIPGAVNVPFAGNLTADAVPVLRSPDELRARFAAVGADRNLPIVYCGSGVTACHDLLALHAAGLRGRLYAGSWSEWSSDPSPSDSDGGEALEPVGDLPQARRAAVLGGHDRIADRPRDAEVGVVPEDRDLVRGVVDARCTCTRRARSRSARRSRGRSRAGSRAGGSPRRRCSSRPSGRRWASRGGCPPPRRRSRPPPPG